MSYLEPASITLLGNATSTKHNLYILAGPYQLYSSIIAIWLQTKQMA